MTITTAVSLDFVRLRDVEAGQSYYEAELPVEIGRGTIVNARIGFQDGYSEIITASIEFIDPDGISRGKVTETTEVGGTVQTQDVVIDKTGDWMVRATANGAWEAWHVISMPSFPWWLFLVGGVAVAAIVITKKRT